MRETVVVTTKLKGQVRPIALAAPGPLIGMGNGQVVSAMVRKLRGGNVSRVCVIINCLGRRFTPLIARCPNIQLVRGPCCSAYGGVTSLCMTESRVRGTVVLSKSRVVCGPSVLTPRFRHSNCGDM